jgi:hyperosmotically inducible periplasmic protein
VKKFSFKPLLISTALALLLSAGCTSMTGQSAGSYVDDSTLTSQVKAKLVAEKAANFTRIDVDTNNKVVSLNGIVETADQKSRAERLAKDVNGVAKVNNNLQVQKKN